MLSHIINYVSNDYLKCSATADGKLYILDSNYEKQVYALNLLLVLESKRLAYRVDIDPNNHRTNQYYA